MFHQPHSSKKIYVLVHGAWHGKWVWNKITPLLQLEGHLVIAPDWPAQDTEEAALGKINFRDGVDFFCKIISELYSVYKRPVIIISHSAGGAYASQLAENIPAFIEGLVFVAAYIPENGKSVLDEVGKPTLKFEPARSDNLVRLRKDQVADILYNGCEQKDIDFALGSLRPQPRKSLAEKLVLSENFKKIPKLYIACEEDKAIPFEHQMKMFARIQNTNTRLLRIKTGHSPFFSNPSLLADLFLKNPLLKKEQPTGNRGIISAVSTSSTAPRSKL